MGIASFISNRGLFKAERIALTLNRSSRELHIIVPWEFKIPIASYSKEVIQPPTLFVFGTLQSFSCNVMQCGPTFYIPGILLRAIRGHPFMTSTRRGGGGQAQ